MANDASVIANETTNAGPVEFPHRKLGYYHRAYRISGSPLWGAMIFHYEFRTRHIEPVMVIDHQTDCVHPNHRVAQSSISMLMFEECDRFGWRLFGDLPLWLPPLDSDGTCFKTSPPEWERARYEGPDGGCQ